MFESSSSTCQPVEVMVTKGAAAVGDVQCSTSSVGSASTVLTLASYSSCGTTSGSIDDIAHPPLPLESYSSCVVYCGVDDIVHPPKESVIQKAGVRFAAEHKVYPFDRHDKREGNIWYNARDIDNFYKSSLNLLTDLDCPTTREWWRASQRVETRPLRWELCLFPHVMAQYIHNSAINADPQYLGLYNLAWTEKIGERREELYERIHVLQRRSKVASDHRQKQMRRVSEQHSRKDVERALYMGECVANSVLEDEEEY